MGNGWHEWPLVLFTVLGQSVAGAIIVSGLGWLSLNNNSEARQRLVRCMFLSGWSWGLPFWHRLSTSARRCGHLTLLPGSVHRR
ncbi:anaerobic dimethyl sulfoxide reductase subunit C [Klebsiella michiganensis]|nr:anaerobic dimethyl sulfoxide reductase subunit C [Klebsiella michiganensis]